MSVEPMRGWAHLWAAADIIRPALVVIDPALDAYTGDPNNLAAVREFVSALGAEAAARGPEPSVRARPIRRRSSRLARALRVSESAGLRQLVCPLRSRPRSRRNSDAKTTQQARPLA